MKIVQIQINLRETGALAFAARRDEPHHQDVACSDFKVDYEIIYNSVVKT